MIVSKENIAGITSESIIKPDAGIFALPEKVLMFGTGILLRGLPAYFIDKANREGIFNGRIVMVKSTSQGSLDELVKQDYLYTLCIRGITCGKEVKENVLNSSVSRIINAGTAWQEVFHCAADKNFSVIISNTTEVGIRYVAESIHASPPQSFPAKLLAFLYQRYKAFGNKAEAGCTIIPTELITSNGDALKAIVTELAVFNHLEDEFIDWLATRNRFCNSLVDRIVPGKMPDEARQQFEEEAGYQDAAVIMAEPYALWAIQGDEKVKQALSFCKADDRVVITNDIEKFRELKLRLLNGTHTFSCALAFLKGFATVKEAMQDNEMKQYIETLMYDEMAPAISYPVPDDEKKAFARDVADRFSNPFIEHKWLSISLNYTDKMRLRNVPLLQHYITTYQKVPHRMALGFAAFLRFMQPVRKEGEDWYGDYEGKEYKINDAKAPFFYELWQDVSPENAVASILKNKDLWGADLTLLDGFCEVVTDKFCATFLS